MIIGPPASTQLAVGLSGTIAAYELFSAAGSLERLGVAREQTDAMLMRSGVALAQRQDVHARVPLEAEYIFWRLAEQTTGDAGIGLRVGVEHALHGRSSLIDYLALNSPSMRQAIMMGAQVVTLVDDRAHIALSERASVAQVAFWRDGPQRARGRIELLMAMVLTYGRDCIPGFVLRDLQFRFERPHAHVPYERFFGLTPRFNAERHAVAFDAHCLEHRLASADHHLCAMLFEHAQHLVSKLPSDDPLLNALRGQLARAMGSGALDPARTARELGMSPRTLRRRLALLGTSYQQLVDELRCSFASVELRHGQSSIDSVAERLGFSGRNAFQRAFRRYTGESPAQYRTRFRRNVAAQTA